MSVVFDRKIKGDMPVLAICYDFDKTLSPYDMQAQGYIQSVGYDVEKFWTESNARAEKNDMDQNLAYMYKMIEESEGKFAVNKEKLMEYGAKIALFPGVEDWFERIKEYGKRHGVTVEHYVISSGLKEMIEGTSIAKKGVFEKIYASSFYFNEKGAAKWPAQVVNYTNKTQFLFRISKGILDINDQGVNEYFNQEDIRVPFRNMVYIGDSDTDVPCMKLVNSYGGHAIGVYNPDTQDKSKVNKMMREGRIRYYAPADYSENTELDKLVKAIIDKTASNEKLENIYYACKRQTEEAYDASSAHQRAKTDAINALEASQSFVRTHEVMTKLSSFSDWNAEEKEALFDIAINNSQVYCILGDSDIKAFYKEVLNNLDILSENAAKVKEKVE